MDQHFCFTCARPSVRCRVPQQGRGVTSALIGSGEMTIMITGSAGFIGFHLSRRLLERGEAVMGVDILNAYYDPTLKAARLAQ